MEETPIMLMIYTPFRIIDYFVHFLTFLIALYTNALICYFMKDEDEPNITESGYTTESNMHDIAESIRGTIL